MSSESERKLSLEELRQMNMHQQLPPEQYPAAADWPELSAALGAIGELLAEQNLTLEDLSRRPYPGPTPDQITEPLQEMKAIHRLLEQAGNAAPVRDATTIHAHGDSKTLRAERQKKIAHGHKEDDHADEPTWQQTM